MARLSARSDISRWHTNSTRAERPHLVLYKLSLSQNSSVFHRENYLESLTKVLFDHSYFPGRSELSHSTSGYRGRVRGIFSIYFQCK